MGLCNIPDTRYYITRTNRERFLQPQPMPPKRKATAIPVVAESSSLIQQQQGAGSSSSAASSSSSSSSVDEPLKRARIEESKSSSSQASANTSVSDIIEELLRLGGANRHGVNPARPEWFEFLTNYSMSSRYIRKKSNELLATVPGLTKAKLSKAAGISTVGMLTKFLENKGGCYDNSGMTSSAEGGLKTLVNILEQSSDGSKKRHNRLSTLLKHGLGKGNLGESSRWRDDKVALFRNAFPGVEPAA